MMNIDLLLLLRRLEGWNLKIQFEDKIWRLNFSQKGLIKINLTLKRQKFKKYYIFWIFILKSLCYDDIIQVEKLWKKLIIDLKRKFYENHSKYLFIQYHISFNKQFPCIQTKKFLINKSAADWFDNHFFSIKRCQ